MQFKFESAKDFSIEDLTDFYNQTREDYLVPMRMNKEDMQDYIHTFDIDLGISIVAMDQTGDRFAGLGMLGMRVKQGWITRLGVVAEFRKIGVGQMIFKRLLVNSERGGFIELQLEVIVGNPGAKKLFEKSGFESRRELVILHRLPIRIQAATSPVIECDREQAMALLAEKRPGISWVTDYRSLLKVKDLQGLRIKKDVFTTLWHNSFKT
jgi:ribosomal protein S18 acetylase RimI-like enzyme